jgi:hypothetical protein
MGGFQPVLFGKAHGYCAIDLRIRSVLNAAYSQQILPGCYTGYVTSSVLQTVAWFAWQLRNRRLELC